MIIDPRELPVSMQEQLAKKILDRLVCVHPVAAASERGGEDVKCDPRAFARCAYNKTCVSVEQTDFPEGSDCDQFNQRILSNPGNYADWIRGMSDMEMAMFLHGATRACADHNCAACPIGESNCCVMLHWLRQPRRET